jgi:hypothetical protein
MQQPATSADPVPPTTKEVVWLTPGVRGIGLASFLADVGHEVPTALLPSLLTTTLGASAAALGVIEGVSDALAGAARFGGGVLADDPARRRATAVGGYTSTAVLAGLTGVAGAVWQVAILRASAWAARGLRVPARNALLGLSFVAAGLGSGCVETAEHAAVAGLAPAALRGSSFGLLASVQAFGNLAASAGAGLLWTWGSPRVAFLYLAAWMLPALVGLLGLSRHVSTGGR